MRDLVDVGLSIGVILFITAISICIGVTVCRDCIIIRPDQEIIEYD
jgi:hypothetical protein